MVALAGEPLNQHVVARVGERVRETRPRVSAGWVHQSEKGVSAVLVVSGCGRSGWGMVDLRVSAGLAHQGEKEIMSGKAVGPQNTHAHSLINRKSCGKSREGQKCGFLTPTSKYKEN